MKNFIFISAVLVLAGCMSSGDVEHPLERKATWFSYLNGDDIRQECVPGSADSTRMIYNARYDRQVRIYEVLAGDNGEATVFERVTGRANLLMVLPGLEQMGSDWHGHTGTTTLDKGQFAALNQTFSDSGIYDAPPEGMKLDSDAFYWVSVACRDGQIYFNAWQYPSDHFNNITFPKVLMDMNLVDIAAPEPALPPLMKSDRKRYRTHFILYLNKDGVARNTHIFGPVE